MRGAEMHGKEQGAVLGAVLQHPAAGGARLRRELAKPRVPVRRVNLQRVMEGVAAEQRAFSPVGKLEDDVARRVPGRGLDQHRVVDRVRAVEQYGLAGLDHRQHAVAIGAPALRVASAAGLRRGSPYSSSARENRYLAFGKVGTQRPSRSIVFQPT